MFAGESVVCKALLHAVFFIFDGDDFVTTAFFLDVFCGNDFAVKLLE